MYSEVTVAKSRCSLRLTGNREMEAPAMNDIDPPVSCLTMNSMPPSGFTSRIAVAASSSGPARNITPALANVFVFVMPVGSAVWYPSLPVDWETDLEPIRRAPDIGARARDLEHAARVR